MMKQMRKVSTILGVLVLLACAVSLFVGCPSPNGGSNTNNSTQVKYITVKYDMTGCYENPTKQDDGFSWKPQNQEEKSGSSFYFTGERYKNTVLSENGKDIIGWSKTKGGPKDYDLGGKVQIENDMTLYPAYGSTAYTTIIYKFPNCKCNTSNGGSWDNWQLKLQKVERGSKLKLADDNSPSTQNKSWKVQYVAPANKKIIIGWSKSETGNTEDYDFGEEIPASKHMVLYPEYAKYKVGDTIGTKVVIFVREGKKQKFLYHQNIKSLQSLGMIGVI